MVQPILITGASTGIGRLLTETLAKDGYEIYACARKKDDIDRLNKIPSVQGVKLDVTNDQDINDLVEFIKQSNKGLHAIVNNAGVGDYQALVDTSSEELQSIIDVNVIGPHKITNAFIKFLISSKGRIINIGSMFGIATTKFMGSYAITKHALEAYSDSLRLELQELGIHVSLIEPGNYKSDIGKTTREKLAKKNENSETKIFPIPLEFITDRTEFKEPTEIIEAIKHSLFSDQPKNRYLVVPDIKEAKFTIKQQVRKLIELNQSQAFTFNNDELFQLILRFEITN